MKVGLPAADLAGSLHVGENDCISACVKIVDASANIGIKEHNEVSTTYTPRSISPPAPVHCSVLSDFSCLILGGTDIVIVRA